MALFAFAIQRFQRLLISGDEVVVARAYDYFPLWCTLVFSPLRTTTDLNTRVRGALWAPSAGELSETLVERQQQGTLTLGPAILGRIHADPSVANDRISLCRLCQAEHLTSGGRAVETYSMYPEVVLKPSATQLNVRCNERMVRCI